MLHRAYNEPNAGHQGTDKILYRLQEEAYWVRVASDVEKHCRECLNCQQRKQLLHTNLNTNWPSLEDGSS